MCGVLENSTLNCTIMSQFAIKLIQIFLFGILIIATKIPMRGSKRGTNFFFFSHIKRNKNNKNRIYSKKIF